METSNYSKCTFAVKVILLCLLSLGGLSCGDKEDPVPIDLPSIEKSFWEKYLEESNFQVSNPEQVNCFTGDKVVGEYTLLFGAKNHHPWISCIDKNGKETGSFEYKDADIKYGYINPKLVIYEYGDTLLISPALCNDTIPKSIGFDILEKIKRIDLIGLDLKTMKTISIISKNITQYTHYDVIQSNHRFYLRIYETDSFNKIYMLDNDLKILFERDVKETELCGNYKNKLSILDDERIAYRTSIGINNNSTTILDDGYINIINLKTYELLHQFNQENLPIKGDRIDDYPKNVKYTIDTLTVETDHFKFLYDEREVNKDPISGITRIGKVLDSYFYKIDPETYEILDWGKIQ